jgi:hypothetical protein
MTGYRNDLRAQLAHIDPARPGMALDPFNSPRAQRLLEQTMETTDESAHPLVPDGMGNRDRRGLRTVATVAAAIVILGLAVTFAATSRHNSSGNAAAPSTLSLSRSAGGGTTIGSCVPFDVKFLRDMPVAFSGTVTQVAADGAVRLHVDHWYKGGHASEVSLAVPGPNTSAALDGVDFKTGSRYLVAAAGGTVNGCGFSGEATPELLRAYSTAFGS